MTYEERLASYGYTPQEIRELSDENRRKMEKINAVNAAGKARGTVNHAQDLATFRNA